ncbi:tigger transposable element-derived protein 6-like [Corticium candelabrum]|uniref:tigger transposable element-derived protein 6-like n=1 Tax=Corticium candelabrum TaxID=121492 RepID=UPI002E25AEF0|nr:tigger transposable element-derived protein 6-like [Corticium candelabrum]
MSQKCKFLTLEDRIPVIEKVEQGKCCRCVAVEMGVGMTQVQSIVRDRKSIRRQWENCRSGPKQKYQSSKLQYDDIDRAVWEWLVEARLRNIPVIGRLIQQRALVYAEQLGHSAFSGSNGWLEKWMTRHNVRLSCLSGEAADVVASVVDDRSRRLQSSCEGYELRDIFNANGMSLSYRALPSRSLVVKGDKEKGSKKTKERITALLA